MLTSERETAARTILEARRRGEKLAGLPGAQTPAGMDEGFALQRAIIVESGERVAGWKIACTAAPVQELFGVSEPFFGAVFESVVHASPAQPEARRFPLGCIESEIAFRMGRDLPPRSEPYDRDEIVASVAAVLPAFEIIEPRFDSLLTDAAPLAFGDCALNGGLVLGKAVADWRDIDLAAVDITLRVDGDVRAEGRGGDALGDPLTALTWLVQALSRYGETLERGQVVSSGTCTGITYVTPGEVAVSEFSGLGEVEVCFR